jgi:hypothetical protein
MKMVASRMKANAGGYGVASWTVHVVLCMKMSPLIVRVNVALVLVFATQLVVHEGDGAVRRVVDVDVGYVIRRGAFTLAMVRPSPRHGGVFLEVAVDDVA